MYLLPRDWSIKIDIFCMHTWESCTRIIGVSLSFGGKISMGAKKISKNRVLLLLWTLSMLFFQFPWKSLYFLNSIDICKPWRYKFPARQMIHQSSISEEQQVKDPADNQVCFRHLASVLLHLTADTHPPAWPALWCLHIRIKVRGRFKTAQEGKPFGFFALFSLVRPF